MLRALSFIPLLIVSIALACDRSSSTAALEGATSPDESQEPPLTYTLRIADQIIAITEGETTRIDGAFNNPEVTLQSKPYREFPYQGVSFKYPREFVFEAELVESSAVAGQDLGTVIPGTGSRPGPAQMTQNPDACQGNSLERESHVKSCDE